MSALLDLAQRLQDEGVGTLWTDIFVGDRPATPDACLTLQTYPGDPNRIHGDTNVPVVQMFAVQVMARAEHQGAAEALAESAFYALPFRMQTINGTRYAHCRADGTPAFVGKDENNRALVRFNVTVRHDNTQHLT